MTPSSLQDTLFLTVLATAAAVAPAASTPAFSVDSVVPGVCERIFAEASPLGEVAWDEANIFLTERESRTSPGLYRGAVTPHVLPLREAMGNPAVRQITIQKNDQAGITRTVLNLVHRIVAERPRNILYAINSLEEARRMSARIKESLLNSPATRDQVTEDPAEDVELQTLTFRLREMTIYFVGGGSIGAVANKQIALVVVDEADKIPRVGSGSNTHIVDEAKSRFKSVPLGDALIIVFSKPNQETDIVHTEYKLGTMERGEMPCPHCGEVQEWVQERLRFDHCKLPSGDYDKARVEKEAYYACRRANTPACPDGKIYDRHRGYTTERISYVATNPNPEPGHRSFILTDFLLNPAHFPDASLGRIALDLIAGFKNPAKMKAVQAARFGLPEMLQRSVLKEEHILALRSNYLRGTAPRGLVYCGIYSDLQGYGPKWVKFGFKRNGELVIIDWGTFLAIDDLMDEARVGAPEVDDTVPLDMALMADAEGEPLPLTHRLGELRAAALRGGQPRTGAMWYPANGGIDEGDQQKYVWGFVIRSELFFLPTKGRGGYQTRGKSLVTPSPRNHEGVDFQAYHFNDDQFKKELYIHRIQNHAKIIAGKSPVPRVHLPLDVDQQYIVEMMAEQLAKKKNENGYLVEEWTVSGHNDYGDATKGALIMWHVVGPDVVAEYDKQNPAPAAPPVSVLA
jgi:hypothetical protein